MQHTRPASQPASVHRITREHTRQENETRAPSLTLRRPSWGWSRPHIHNKSGGGSAFWLCQRPQQLVLVTSFCSRKAAADSPNAFLPAKSHSSGGDYFYTYIHNSSQHSQLERVYSCSRRCEIYRPVMLPDELSLS